MKTFTKRVLSLALAVVLFAVCFAGMTVMTATADAAGGGTDPIKAAGGYIKTTNLEETNASDYHYASKSLFKMTVGSTYTIDFDMYSNSTAFSLSIDGGDGKSPSGASVSQTNVWEHKTLTFTCTAGVNARIYTNNKLAGGLFVCYDNIIVRDRSTGAVVYSNDFTSANETTPTSAGTVSECVPAVAAMLTHPDELPENSDGGFIKFTTPDHTGDTVYGYCQITCKMPFTAGTKYYISYDVMSNRKDIKVALDNWYQDDGKGGWSSGTKEQLTDSFLWDEWETVSWNYTPEKSGSQLRLYINVKPQSELLIDNIKICDANDRSVVYYSETFDKYELDTNKTSLTSSNDATCVLAPWKLDLAETNENKDRTFAVMEHKKFDGSDKCSYDNLLFYPTVPMESNKTYIVSYDMYMSKIVNAGVRFKNKSGNIFYNVQGKSNGWDSPDSAYTWQTRERVFTVPEDVEIDYLEFYTNSGSTSENIMFFDNIKIYEQDDHDKVCLDDNCDFQNYKKTSDKTGYLHGADITKLANISDHGGYVYMDLARPQSGNAYSEIKGSTHFNSGEQYTVSFNVLTNRKEILPQFDIWKTNDWSTVRSSFTLTQVGAWINVQATYTTDTTSDKFRIYVNTANFGKLLIDDVVIKDKDENEIYSNNFNKINNSDLLYSNAAWIRYDCKDVHSEFEYVPYETQHKYECVYCGYSADGLVDHTWVIAKDTGDTHWYECSLCQTEQAGSRAAHIFDHAYDTGCNVCGYERWVGVCGNVYVDGDEVVIDIFDLFILAKHIAGTDVSSLYNAANADIDGNGVVDQADLDLFATYWLENESFTEDDLPIVPAQ